MLERLFAVTTRRESFVRFQLLGSLCVARCVALGFGLCVALLSISEPKIRLRGAQMGKALASLRGLTLCTHMFPVWQ